MPNGHGSSLIAEANIDEFPPPVLTLVDRKEEFYVEDPGEYTTLHREPPVLSREFLDSLITAHNGENCTNFRDAYYNWLRGAESLRDAILESLSQEDAT